MSTEQIVELAALLSKMSEADRDKMLYFATGLKQGMETKNGNA